MGLYIVLIYETSSLLRPLSTSAISGCIIRTSLLFRNRNIVSVGLLRDSLSSMFCQGYIGYILLDYPEVENNQHFEIRPTAI